MAALVQTIPQQTGTISLVQSRPASSGSLGSQQQQQHPQQQFHHQQFQHQHQQQQQQQQQMARGQQVPRNPYSHHSNASMPSSGFRPATSQPVAPYAFTSTPVPGNYPARPGHQPFQMRPDSRTVSASAVPQQPQDKPLYPGPVPVRGYPLPPNAGHQHAASMSSPSFTNSSSSSSARLHHSQDDFALPSRNNAHDPRQRPMSTVDLSLPPLSVPSPQTTSSGAKPSPDRYRRGQRRGGESNKATTQSNSGPVGMRPATPSSQDGHGSKDFSLPPLVYPTDATSTQSRHTRGASADDAHIKKSHSTPELAKRYRRRSLGSIDPAGLVNLSSAPDSTHTSTLLSAAHDGPSARPSSSGSSGGASQTSADGKSESKPGHSASRSVDTGKRAPNPSPLSNRLSMSQDDATITATPKLVPAQAAQEAERPADKVQSPATKRLTELSKKGGKKSGKSRLRRALSFGSAAELRAASEAEEQKKDVSRKQQLDEELGAEQAAIAERQEASGLGENIYSGQGNIFSGSTDNLSLSSTASSASVMLRKMGKGMKRSTRSLVGLFRPKSIRDPAGEPTTLEPSQPQVSMVTVEAQRDNEPHSFDSADGRVASRDGPVGTVGAVDRSSEESDQNFDSNLARKSIIGSDSDRAEVLAAVRKGILKKTGSNSPIVKPADSPGAHIPHINESPRSSAPSSPVEHSPRGAGHRRTESVTIEGDDYFLPIGRFSASHANSAPVTPETAAKNISFSPRIQFHDTWPSGEYDRRGETATCNRLTPLLAQQIKEELNTFKMEMEVHESSKVYTHFF